MPFSDDNEKGVGKPLTSEQWDDIERGIGHPMTMSGKPRSSDQPPTTLVGDFECTECKRPVETDKEAIKCCMCRNWFHGLNCAAPDYLAVSNNKTSFANVKHAVCKTSGFKSTFGKFLFVCNQCLSEHEKQEALTMDNRVTLLNEKFESMERNINVQMLELQKSIKEIKTPSHDTYLDSTNSQTSLSSIDSNPWQNPDRSKHLRETMVVVRNDAEGNSLNRDIIEEAVVNSNIPVIRTFELPKTKEMAMVLKSQDDFTHLKNTLKSSAPDHKIETLATNKPRITIVGLQKQYSIEKFESILSQQNEHIASVVNKATLSDDEKYIEVVAVVPLRKNKDEYKAIVKVSNVVRSEISKHGDKVFAGLQSRCRVYDNYFILRCYNCQEFGHHSTKCDKPGPACAYCAGQHRSDACRRKEDEGTKCCKNCKLANKEVTDHYASDSTCPLLLDAQRKLKMKTPFYRQQMLDSRRE